MVRRKLVVFSTVAIALMLVFALTIGSAPAVEAQISVGINIGAAPICPYGYFDYAPYDCAPYGYYGPDWFVNGVFIGAGPWFHGPKGFAGHVDNRYDPRNGYKGPLPARGASAFNTFHGNEARDGKGNVATATHSATNEHAAGYSHAGGGKGGGRH